MKQDNRFCVLEKPRPRGIVDEISREVIGSQNAVRMRFHREDGR